MKILLIAGIAAFATIALVLAIGALLPKSHVASRSMLIHAEPSSLYAIVRDVGQAPKWRDVQSVELLDGHRFREHARHGTVTYEIVADEPPTRFATRIVDQNLGYSGSWTFVLEPASGGTLVTITERGEITNVLFRFLARFVFGYTRSMQQALTGLRQYAEGRMAGTA